MDVRTAGGFADRVQAAPAQLRFQQMHRFEMSLALAEPHRAGAVALEVAGVFDLD